MLDNELISFTDYYIGAHETCILLKRASWIYDK
jgi:hypothetical protein